MRCRDVDTTHLPGSQILHPPCARGNMYISRSASRGSPSRSPCTYVGSLPDLEAGRATEPPKKRSWSCISAFLERYTNCCSPRCYCTLL